MYKLFKNQIYGELISTSLKFLAFSTFTLKIGSEIFFSFEVLIEKFKILDNLYQNNNEQYLEKYIQISINLVNSFIYINKFDIRTQSS